MTKVDGNRMPKLLIFRYCVELGDRTLFVVTNGYSRDKDTAFTAYEKLGGAMRKHVFDETVFLNDPDG